MGEKMKEKNEQEELERYFQGLRLIENLRPMPREHFASVLRIYCRAGG
jgi:hypothetical protein